MHPQDSLGIQIVLFRKGGEADETGKRAFEVVKKIALEMKGCSYLELTPENIDEYEAVQEIHPGMYGIFFFPAVVILKEGKVLFRFVGLDRIMTMHDMISRAFTGS